LRRENVAASQSSPPPRNRSAVLRLEGCVTEDPELLAFLQANIRSVWALELWLLLWSAPERGRTSADLVLELRASTKIVKDVVAQFARDGLIAPDDQRWRISPAHLRLQAVADRLAQVYRERPLYVMGLIRQDPVQSLADAFKIKGDGK
jgi:hypothetical protein